VFISECLIPTKNCCYKKDHVLPCPIVGCLWTRSTSPLGQASILKGGNELHQGLVQSVPNFQRHWFTSQVCSLSTHITRGNDQTKSGTSRRVYNSWVRCLSHLEQCLQKCLNTLHNWNLNAYPLIKTYLLQCNAPKSTRPYTWKWRFAGTSPLITELCTMVSQLVQSCLFHFDMCL
jgi:hypothetical protein